MTSTLPTTTAATPDHSFLSDLVHCERLAFYKYLRWLERRDGDAPYLTAGSAMHEGMRALYSSPSRDVEAAVDAVVGYAKSHDLRPTGRFDFLTPGHLEVVMRNYADHWKDREPYDIVERVEEPIITGIGLDDDVGGIPDLIVQDDQNRYLILDHKFTTGFIGDRLYNRTKYSHQLRLYALLARQVYGYDIRGGVVNAGYMGKYATSPTTKATLFDRWRFDWSKEQLEETRQWVKRAWNRWLLLRRIDDEESFMQNGGSHCGYCEFGDLCAAPPPLRESRIRTNFKVRERSGQLLSGADDN